MKNRLSQPLNLHLESLETRRMLAVTIWAEGATGEETMELQVDGQTVQTWTNVGVGLQSRTYQVDGIALDRLRVAFTNDGTTSSGADKNLRVDRLVVDGTEYQTEDSSVFSSGSWSAGNGCDPGFKNSEWLHCNGYFQFAQVGNATITIDAAGQVGDEAMALRINGVTVAEWQNVGGNLVTGEFNTFTYQHVAPVSIDEISVAFTNDAVTGGGDRNLRVDHVTIDGFVFETEHPSVLSTGTWTNGVGCTPGNKQSEVLHCGGEFQFFGTSVAVLAAGDTGEETMELQIDGTAVATWNNVAGDPAARDFLRFMYHTTDEVTAEQIRVAFVNDGNSGGGDRNLHVDRIEVDQVLYQSESPATFSTGTWGSSDGCDPGYKASETLHCGGYLQFGAGEQPNPGIIALATNSIDVNEADGFADAVVTRTGGSGGLVTVDYRTVIGTAVPNEDYTSVAGRLFFQPGETSKTIQIPILQDSLVEGDETFSITIDNANGGATLLAPRTAIITLRDDESPTGLGGFEVTYADFNAAVNVTQNGSASIVGNALQLTGSGTNLAGSAFYNQAIEFGGGASFRTNFSFQLTGGQGSGGADGFTFALHNTSGEDGALGSTGGALGFGGLGSPSFAVEFDTYQNGADPSANHVAVIQSGDVGNHLATATAPFDLNSGGVGYAWIEYDGATNLLSVYVASTATQPGSALINTTVDLASLGSRAYFGFTGATGGLSNNHRVLNWTFESSTDLAPLPVSFTGQTVVSGLSQPTSIDWSPDGRNMYVSQKNGVVRVVRDGVLQNAPFIDISAQVNGVRDRGLLDLAVHPDFVNNPYVYLLFTYDPPEVNGNTGLAGPDGRGNRAARMIRVTANSSNDYLTAVSGSEVVILGTNSTWNNFNGFANSTNDFNEPPAGILPDGTNIQDFLAADSESHTIGGVEFGPDGALYVSNGDGTSYNQVDPRTVRVQDIDNLSGKILRIDPITGAGLTDNPFYQSSDPNSNRSKVYQYGLRNPFRITVNQDTGAVFIGDVGWTRWEEVNSAGPGANFGWPYYEGGSGTNLRTNQYENLPEAQAFYNSGQVATPSVFALNHSADGINAIVLGDFYTGSVYPSQFQGDLLVNDLGGGIVRNLSFDVSGNLESVETFATGANIVVAMKDGPDGYMYYVDLDDGEVGRWVVSAGGSSSSNASGAATGSDGTASTDPSWIKWGTALARIDARRVDSPLVLNLHDGVITTDVEQIEIPDHIRRFVIKGGNGDSGALHVVTTASPTDATIRPGRLTTSAVDARVRAIGFEQYTVVAAGAAEATLRGGRGDDALTVGARDVLLESSHHWARLIGFSQTTASAAGGGVDRVTFGDSGGDDVLNLAGRVATFASQHQSIEAIGFRETNATSNVGYDTATLVAGHGRDEVSVTEFATTIKSGRYSHEVVGYASVAIVSNGRGADKLSIASSAQADHLEANARYGALWFDEERFVSFQGFDQVHVHSFNVHRDRISVGELDFELRVTEQEEL